MKQYLFGMIMLLDAWGTIPSVCRLSATFQNSFLEPSKTYSGILSTRSIPYQADVNPFHLVYYYAVRQTRPVGTRDQIQEAAS